MKKIRSFLRYLITLAVAGGLLWYVYKDQDLDAMIDRLNQVDYQWLIYSILLALASHLVRAYRWNMLLKPLGYKLKLSRTFLAVMVGYLVNLALPRAGEISRCGILKRTDNVNMSLSIGTVIAERAIDFIILIIVLLFAFVVEFDLLNNYVSGIVENNLAALGRNLIFIYIIAGIGAIAIVALFILIRRYKALLRRNRLFLAIRKLLRDLAQGFTSIGKVPNVTAFVFSSIMIWVFYYLMAYVVFFAIPETSTLSLTAGLSILAMGSLGMVAPVQGGIGTYHALVAGALVLYGIEEQSSAFFAGLMHSAQVVMILVVGGAALYISMVIKRKGQAKTSAGSPTA